MGQLPEASHSRFPPILLLENTAAVSMVIKVRADLLEGYEDTEAGKD